MIYCAAKEIIVDEPARLVAPAGTSQSHKQRMPAAVRRNTCSVLLRKAGRERIQYLNDLADKLAYKGGGTAKDETFCSASSS